MDCRMLRGFNLSSRCDCVFVGLVVVFVSQGILSADPLETRIESLPSCGPVASYAFLAAVGRETTIHEVEAKFREINPSLDLSRVSLWDIREVLARFGVSTIAVRQPQKRLAKLQTPAILFVKGQRSLLSANDAVGHFVFLASIDSDHAEVIDWSQTIGPQRHRVSTGTLAAEWDGEGVVLEDSVMNAGWVASIAAGLVVSMSLAWCLWLTLKEYKQRGTSTTATTLFWLAVLANSGCTKTESPKPSETPLIRFEKPSQNLGKIASAQPIRVEFAFQVCSDQSVTITEVAPCCGTLFVNKELIGQPLTPGSQHKIEMEANVASGDAQPRTSFARITTEPPSTTPLVVAFTYFPKGSPRPLAKEVVVKGRPKESCDAEVTTVAWRLQKDSPVRLVRSKCACADFEITTVKERSESVTTNEHTGEQSQQDFQSIHLRSRQAFGLGEHRSLLRLAWNDDTTTEVFLIVKVAPPIHPAIDRLFVGVLSPGQEWKRNIAIIQEERTTLSFAAAVCSVDFMTATISSDGRNLEVRVTAPPVAGRIEGDIELRLQPGVWPVVRIPVTGIVK